MRRRKTASGQRYSEHFTVTMTSGMVERLFQESERRHMSMANIVREAVDQWLKKLSAEEKAA